MGCDFYKEEYIKVIYKDGKIDKIILDKRKIYDFSNTEIEYIEEEVIFENNEYVKESCRFIYFLSKIKINLVSKIIYVEETVKR